MQAERSAQAVWPLAIVALALISLGTPLCWLSGYGLATQYEDDAFYYFQIAKNVAHGRGFTFDGLHETNGFHPLWLALLVPLFRVLPGLDLPVRAAGLLETLLLGCAGALVYAVMRRSAPRYTALLSGVLVYALPGTRNHTRVGLETALCMCLLAALWHAGVQLAERTTRARLLGAGTLCALATLARLEALCALAVLCWLLRSQLRAADVLWLVAPPLATLAAYVSWNQLQFGTLLPVSGMAKQLWAGAELRGIPGLYFSPLAWVLLCAAAALALGRWLGPRVPWLSRLYFPLCSALAMLGLDFASLGHLERWYLGVLVLAAAPTLASALSASRRASLLALAAVVGLALWRVPYTVRSIDVAQYQAELRGEAADWLRAHLPPNTRVGAWNGGMFGYYSGQHIIMLDGLANSPEFYRRALRDGDLLGYLRDERVDHLVTLNCNFDPVLWTARSVDHERYLSRSYERRGPVSDRQLKDPCNDAFQLWVRK